ncbi:MAG: hypothetical protein AAGN46_08975 [Acidobacteriota bacterium]
MSRSSRALRLPRLGFWLVVVLSALIAGCSGCSPEPGPEWLRELPAADLDAIPDGAAVWAAVPRGEHGALQLGIQRLISAEDGSRRLVDALGVEAPVLAPALVHPLPEGNPPSAGTAVLIDRFDVHGAVARWRADGARPIVALDRHGTTVETDVAHAQPFPVDGLPRRVVYAGENVRHLGIAVAASEEQVWILEASGFVAVAPVADVSPAGPLDAAAVGDRVRAWTWADGLRDAQVIEIVEPRLRWRVRFDDGAERTLWFADVLPAGPPSIG